MAALTLAQKVAAQREAKAQLALRFANLHPEGSHARMGYECAAQFWSEAADAARAGDLTPVWPEPRA